MRRTFFQLRTLCGLLTAGAAMAFLVGCVPAPSAIQTSPSATTPSRTVQSIFSVSVQDVSVEPLSGHDVLLPNFDIESMLPLEEYENLTVEPDWMDFLKVDDENPDRFDIVETSDHATHVLYGFYDSSEDSGRDLRPRLSATREGVEASRIHFWYDLDRDESFVRASFPQASTAPVTIESRDENVVFWVEDEDGGAFYRRYTFEPVGPEPLESLKAVVITFQVSNQDGERFEGLESDLVRVMVRNPWDEGRFGGLPVEDFVSLGSGVYRLRVLMLDASPAGALSFGVEIAQPELPIEAKFYRR